MKFAHLLVSACFVDRPEIGRFVEAPAEVVFEHPTGGSRSTGSTPASLGGSAAAQTPTRDDRVRTSALRDTNSEQTTASMTKGR
jgi:hypothetical protein